MSSCPPMNKHGYSQRAAACWDPARAWRLHRHTRFPRLKARSNLRACSMMPAFHSRNGDWLLLRTNSRSGNLPSISRRRSALPEQACAECRMTETRRTLSRLSGLRGTKARSWCRPCQGGRYAQVQALFDRGHLIAAHTSAQTAVGIGPSAAGRISVDHPFVRHDVAALGERLNWHGGITLDYLFSGRDYAYIECNPRTVEPANAAASGVDLPGLQLRLSLGEHPDPVPSGQAGVRTHSSLAIVLGTAAYRRSGAAVLREALCLAFHRGPYKRSRECLTPVFADFPSLIPLAMVTGRALFSPVSVERFAASAVKAYSVTPEAIERVTKMASDARGPDHISSDAQMCCKNRASNMV